MTGIDTLALISLAAAAAGTGMQMHAGAQEKDAQEKAVRDEMLRQSGYQRKSTQEYQDSVMKGSPDAVKKNMATDVAARDAELNKATAAPLGGSSALPASSETQKAGQVAQGEQSAQARAKMGAYSDYDLEQWIKNLRATQKISTLADFAHQSQAILPFALQDAARSHEGERSAGQLVSALGSLAGAGSAAGGAGGIMSLLGGAASPKVSQTFSATQSPVFGPFTKIPNIPIYDTF